MNFPRHWAKATANRFQCWRWSDVSEEDARKQAEGAVRALAERFKGTKQLPAQLHYGYADRPLREQVLREFNNPAGERIAVITRNLPGCQVLNTARALFVDIDFPEPQFEFFGWLKRMFAPAGPRKPGEADFEGGALAKADAWVRAHPGWCWRAYRTKAGMRLLATHDVFNPTSEIVEEVFEKLGADPLYRRLCRAQESFRARLTPKPWRCGVHTPDAQWPWPDASTEAHFRQWEEKYRLVCGRFATCRLLETVGHPEVHPDLQPLVTIHDEITRVDQPLELA